MSQPTKQYNARIAVKLSSDLLPQPLLSKSELEAKLRDALDVGAPDSTVVSVSVSDPGDTRPRRR